jgi:hypothetical protein
MKRVVRALPFTVGFLGVMGFGWFGLPAVLHEKVEQPFQFSHLKHVEDVGSSCEDCHPFGDDGRFVGLPPLATCVECHEEVQGETPQEKHFVEAYVGTGREVPWLVYARQPDNTWFPHAAHVKGAEIACERCHGDHGTTERLRPFERHRLTGYSADIWGSDLGRLGVVPQLRGMKMSDCESCHRENGVEAGCLGCHR